VGAIDGTNVLARVPKRHRAAFMGRKHTTTQNVLAAVDFDLRFTYVLAGWEGSAHNARILADALERDDGLRVPQGISIWLNLSAMVLYVLVQSFNFSPLSFCLGKFFLVDAGYAVRPRFLPPYRDTRYHLREYGVRSP